MLWLWRWDGWAWPQVEAWGGKCGRCSPGLVGLGSRRFRSECMWPSVWCGIHPTLSLIWWIIRVKGYRSCGYLYAQPHLDTIAVFSQCRRHWRFRVATRRTGGRRVLRMDCYCPGGLSFGRSGVWCLTFSILDRWSHQPYWQRWRVKPRLWPVRWRARHLHE